MPCFTHPGSNITNLPRAKAFQYHSPSKHSVLLDTKNWNILYWLITDQVPRPNHCFTAYIGQGKYFSIIEQYIIFSTESKSKDGGKNIFALQYKSKRPSTGVYYELTYFLYFLQRIFGK